MTSLEDAAHIIGEQRLLLQKMAEALKPFSVEGRAWKRTLELGDDCRVRIGRADLNEHFATGINLSDFVRADEALTAYEKARSRAAINTQER